MALTRKNRGGNKMMNNCKEKYCKKYTEKNGKIIKDLITFFEKLPNKTKKQQALVKKMKTKKYHDENMKKLMNSCLNQYCNPGCKETLFEPTSKLPKKIEKLFKKKPTLLKFMKNVKKEMFKGKKNILKDNFYEGLTDSQVKYLKKEGAISGCVKNLPNK